MRVFILTNGHFPIGMAPAKRTICYAKALIQEGVDCKVIVFSKVDIRKDGCKKIGIFDGVPFEYIGNDVKTNNKFISKFRSWQSQVKLIYYLKKNLKPGDVVFAYVNDIYTSLMDSVIKIVHRNNAKYVRELCELPFKVNEEKKSIDSRKNILERQFPKYDGVVSISENLKQLAKEYCSSSCKIIKVPIMVEYDQYALDDISDKVNTPYIFHSGTLTEQKDGILGMIEAFGMATTQLDFPIHFISTGVKENSRFSKEIEMLVEKYDLSDKLFFRGFVDSDSLRQYLQQASMVIINKYPTQQNEYCFSTKLGEYMAAGKAIIVTDVGEAMNWLTNRKDSIIVETQNLTELSNAIIELFKNPSLRKAIGVNARETCKKSFDYRVYALQLKQFFSSLFQS